MDGIEKIIKEKQKNVFLKERTLYGMNKIKEFMEGKFTISRNGEEIQLTIEEMEEFRKMENAYTSIGVLDTCLDYAMEELELSNEISEELREELYQNEAFLLELNENISNELLQDAGEVEQRHLDILLKKYLNK